MCTGGGCGEGLSTPEKSAILLYSDALLKNSTPKWQSLVTCLPDDYGGHCLHAPPLLFIPRLSQTYIRYLDMDSHGHLLL